ncbi:tetratricopeptide repeat protein [Entomospira culicis]|uniref:Tetratricopeptide repeat protein n=1 Tax=Entomospira culicis TaxID=2719989 RepID=A0A968KW30_9SPIO|nr:tetratricopeptide repeat protein [Entomospira culicis]NIZ18521.1 tetratricopeptide repeat protein [Entomospira culicis]NIZ68737.1 tetratricopeptide repeat protein [Entomospira culicis]WDI37333.1 tetratricopeptide repeat protein [Entomospira culicis]WDI38962.1 tetratricopeptide repeat protein [Entomospira culicis]
MRRRLLSRTNMFGLFVVMVFVIIGLAFYVGARAVRIYVGSLREREDIVELLNEGNFLRVLFLAEDTLAMNPVDANARAFAGIASFYLGVYSYEPQERTRYLRDAIYHLRLALELDKDFVFRAQVHYVLAQAYLHLNEYYANVAVEHLLSARELGYDVAQIHEHLGVAYIRMGDAERGVAHLQQVHGERSSQYHIILGDAYAMSGKFLDARGEFLRALELNQDDNVRDRIEMKLAKVYYDMGNLTEAKQLYLLLLRRFPDDAQAHFILGKIYEEEGNLNLARASWRRSLQLNPQNSEAYAKIYGE